MKNFIGIFLTIFLTNFVLAAKSNSAKYVWIEGAKAKTYPEIDKMKAYDYIEDTGSLVALRKKCEKNVDVTASPIVVEINNMTTKQLSNMRYVVTGDVSGYCRVGWTSKRYETFKWCSEMKRGVANCAIDFPY